MNIDNNGENSSNIEEMGVKLILAKKYGLSHHLDHFKASIQCSETCKTLKQDVKIEK